MTSSPKMAFTQLRRSFTMDEAAPLLANSPPMARLMGLGQLSQIGGKPAMDRIVSMLRDPDEMIQWRARFELRRITGQKPGPNPAAYEQWWKQNRDTFHISLAGRAAIPKPIAPSGQLISQQNPLELTFYTSTLRKGIYNQ